MAWLFFSFAWGLVNGGEKRGGCLCTYVILYFYSEVKTVFLTSMMRFREGGGKGGKEFWTRLVSSSSWMGGFISDRQDVIHKCMYSFTNTLRSNLQDHVMLRLQRYLKSQKGEVIGNAGIDLVKLHYVDWR